MQVYKYQNNAFFVFYNANSKEYGHKGRNPKRKNRIIGGPSNETISSKY